MAGLPYDGPGCISSNTDREQELQHPSQAERHIAEGAEHIKWQQEVLAILERISVSAEAIEGARALLTTLLQTQAQREQDRDRIRASLDCNLDLSSTLPFAQPVDHQNEAAVVGGVAGPHLCADRTPVQLEAKKLENLGEGRPSETASFDAVSQDEATDRLNASRGSLSSTLPLAQPVDDQNEAAVVGGVAGPHLCADRTPVQLDAKKLEILGEGRPSETASCDAVSQDEATDRLNTSRGSLSSTLPFAQPVDDQNKAAVVGGVAGPHLCADRPPVQLEAKKLEILGEGRPSETASCDAVSQDEATDRLNTSRGSLSSTLPLAQPVDHQNEAAVVGGVAGPHLCADRTPVQLEAKKFENLGEGRPSETASFDAVSQDEATDRLNTSRGSLSSTLTLAQPVDHQNEAAVVGGVAGPHLCADRTPVQLEAEKLEILGEGRPSETASFDAVSQDEATDRLN